MALFNFRSKGGGSLASLASVKGWNGQVARDIDADRVYKTSGGIEGEAILNADIVSSVIEIVTKVARMEFELKVDNQRKDSRILHLLNHKPNQWESAYNFKFKILSESIIKGNSYIEIVRDSKGGVDSFRRLKNEWVAIYTLGNEGHEEYYADVEYYVATNKKGVVTESTSDNELARKIANGDGRILERENIIHLKPFNFEGLVGLSLLDYLQEDISIGDETKKFLNYFVRTGGSLGGEIKLDSGAKSLPKDKKDLLRDEFMKANSHYTSLVVTDGKMSYIPRQTSDKVITSLLENKTSATRFAQVFQLPLHKMGVSTSNMSLAQLNQEFKTNTLGNYVKMLESEFNDKVFRIKEDYKSNLVINVNNTSSLSEEERLARVDLGMKTGTLTINEARVLLGEDRKDLPSLDKHRVSLNYVSSELADEYQIVQSEGLVGEGESDEVVEGEDGGGENSE